LQPSLFTRLAGAEAELQAVEEVLAAVLDVLAELKANQDQMRQDHDARYGRAERLLADQLRSRQPLGDGDSVFGRVRSPIQASLTRVRFLLNCIHVPAALDLIRKDETDFWKGMGRTAITGLFLIAVFMIGYQLLNQN
jgi:hypothetical protein